VKTAAWSSGSSIVILVILAPSSPWDTPAHNFDYAPGQGLGGSVVKDIHGLPFHGSPGRSLIRRDDTASAPSFISHEIPSASSGVRSAMNCGERIFAAIFCSN